MMAGHVMISVVGGLVVSLAVMRRIGFLGVAAGGVLLWLFELIVSFVQALVFVILLYNYYLEARE